MVTAFTVVVHGKILIYCTSTYNAKLYSSFSSYLYFYHASTTKTIISFINIWNYIRWEFMTQGQRKCFFLKSVVIKMSFFYQGHVYARVCLHQAMTHAHLFMWTVYVRVFMTKKSPKLCRDCLLAVCMSLSVNRKQSVWRDFPFQTPWKMQQKRVYCHLCLTLISIFMSDTSQLHNDSFFLLWSW